MRSELKWRCWVLSTRQTHLHSSCCLNRYSRKIFLFKFILFLIVSTSPLEELLVPSHPAARAVTISELQAQLNSSLQKMTNAAYKRPMESLEMLFSGKQLSSLEDIFFLLFSFPLRTSASKESPVLSAFTQK